MNTNSLAKNILSNIGGKSNIEQFNHCATRLRINLHDLSKVDISNLENEDGIIRTIISGSQLQIIVGSHVNKVYESINKLILSDNSEIIIDKQAKVNNTTNYSTIFKNACSVFSATMTPLIGPLLSVGLLKGLLTIAIIFNVISLNTPSISLIYHLYDITIFFLPFLIGYTASLAFGGSSALMLTIIATLFFMPSSNVNISSFNELINSTSYSSTLFPAIFCVLFSSTIEKTLKKLINNSISFIIIPLITLAICVPLCIYYIGPFGYWFSHAAAYYYNELFSVSPIIVCFIIAGLWQLAVLAGIHWVLASLMFNTLLISGYDTILPLLIPAVLGQAGAALGVYLINKITKKQKIGLHPILSAIFGLTEPVIYKINMPLRFPFIIGCISASIGGIAYGAYQVKIYSFGILGILSLLQTETLTGTGYITAGLIGGLVTIICALLITVLYMIIKPKQLQP